jgi:predicted transcriptional regulator
MKHTDQKTSDIRQKIQYYWETKGKAERGLTQVKAAQLLGISQPAFSFYLSGNNPSYVAKKSKMVFNTDFIRKFADLVGVKPSDIDDSLLDIDTAMSGLVKKSISVKYTLSGFEKTMERIAVNFPIVPVGTFAVEIDMDNYAGLRKGQMLICDPDAKIHEHDEVFLRKGKEHYFGELRSLTNAWYVTFTWNGKTYNEPVDGGKLAYVMAVQNMPKNGKPYDV